VRSALHPLLTPRGARPSRFALSTALRTLRRRTSHCTPPPGTDTPYTKKAEAIARLGSVVRERLPDFS